MFGNILARAFFCVPQKHNHHHLAFHFDCVISLLLHVLILPFYALFCNHLEANNQLKSNISIVLVDKRVHENFMWLANFVYHQKTTIIISLINLDFIRTPQEKLIYTRPILSWSSACSVSSNYKLLSNSSSDKNICQEVDISYNWRYYSTLTSPT